MSVCIIHANSYSVLPISIIHAEDASVMLLQPPRAVTKLWCKLYFKRTTFVMRTKCWMVRYDKVFYKFEEHLLSQTIFVSWTQFFIFFLQRPKDKLSLWLFYIFGPPSQNYNRLFLKCIPHLLFSDDPPNGNHSLDPSQSTSCSSQFLDTTALTHMPYANASASPTVGAPQSAPLQWTPSSGHNQTLAALYRDPLQHALIPLSYLMCVELITHDITAATVW